MSQQELIRTRFAPSPSGHLHVGGARTAMFCLAFAKRHGSDHGQMLLRIEDTDQRRSSEAASMAFLEDLEWLGISWDEGPQFGDSGGGDTGPYFQSKRLSIYEEHLNGLLERGQAYRAFETTEQLNEKRAEARAAKQPYRYDRAALGLSEKQVSDLLAAGTPYVVRFKVPDEAITVHDEVLGEVRTESGQLDDFIIWKADGFPTYHLAVVIDDASMGVTHVIRGQEHLNNTPKHVVLQDALGFDRPVYAHLSLIMNPDGSKMSKRDQDKTLRRAVKEAGLTESPSGAGGPVIEAASWSTWLARKDAQLQPDETERLAQELGVQLPEINVNDFRRAGYLPEVLLNYLALLGWSPGGDLEQFDMAFLIENFDLNRVVKSPARFDRDKLLAFNLDAIQAMSGSQFESRLRAYCEAEVPSFIEQLTDLQFKQVAACNQERSKTLRDPVEACQFLLLPTESITIQDSKSVRRAMAGGPPAGADHLLELKSRLAALDPWDVATLEGVIEAYAQEHADGKLGKVAQPLRVAVTGTTVSPPIYDTLVMLGRTETMARINQCLDQIGSRAE